MSTLPTRVILRNKLSTLVYGDSRPLDSKKQYFTILSAPHVAALHPTVNIEETAEEKQTSTLGDIFFLSVLLPFPFAGDSDDLVSHLLP